MRIALDYDGTYTCNPGFWDDFINSCRSKKIELVCVTMRYDKVEERIDIGIPVYYTGRKAKSPYMVGLGIPIDIWIDDMPFFIERDAIL